MSMLLLDLKVRRLLAEAAIRKVVGREYDLHKKFWKKEIDELVCLDPFSTQVPSGNAHDSTCVASSHYKRAARELINPA